jgi:hypothetical protein
MLATRVLLRALVLVCVRRPWVLLHSTGVTQDCHTHIVRLSQTLTHIMLDISTATPALHHANYATQPHGHVSECLQEHARVECLRARSLTGHHMHTSMHICALPGPMFCAHAHFKHDSQHPTLSMCTNNALLPCAFPSLSHRGRHALTIAQQIFQPSGLRPYR